MRIGLLLKKYRAIMELDMRTVADEIGISAATLLRVEHGRIPDGRTLAKLLAWLFAEVKKERTAK